MRRPSKQNKDTENVPPGGRAFQRIQQDRTARGLGKLPAPGASSSVPNERVPNRCPDKTRKKK